MSKDIIGGHSKLKGMLTRFCPTAYHVKRLVALFRRRSKIYRSCWNDEREVTISHLLYGCSALSRKRIRHFRVAFKDSLCCVAGAKETDVINFVRKPQVDGNEALELENILSGIIIDQFRTEWVEA